MILLSLVNRLGKLPGLAIFIKDLLSKLFSPTSGCNFIISASLRKAHLIYALWSEAVSSNVKPTAGKHNNFSRSYRYDVSVTHYEVGDTVTFLVELDPSLVRHSPESGLQSFFVIFTVFSILLILTTTNA
jgi:hypothetical protein